MEDAIDSEEIQGIPAASRTRGAGTRSCPGASRTWQHVQASSSRHSIQTSHFQPTRHSYSSARYATNTMSPACHNSSPNSHSAPTTLRYRCVERCRPDLDPTLIRILHEMAPTTRGELILLRDLARDGAPLGWLLDQGADMYQPHEYPQT